AIENTRRTDVDVFYTPLLKGFLVFVSGHRERLRHNRVSTILRYWTNARIDEHLHVGDIYNPCGSLLSLRAKPLKFLMWRVSCLRGRAKAGLVTSLWTV